MTSHSLMTKTKAIKGSPRPCPITSLISIFTQVTLFKLAFSQFFHSRALTCTVASD